MASERDNDSEQPLTRARSSKPRSHSSKPKGRSTVIQEGKASGKSASRARCSAQSGKPCRNCRRRRSPVAYVFIKARRCPTRSKRRSTGSRSRTRSRAITNRASSAKSRVRSRSAVRRASNGKSCARLNAAANRDSGSKSRARSRAIVSRRATSGKSKSGARAPSRNRRVPDVKPDRARSRDVTRSRASDVKSRARSRSAVSRQAQSGKPKVGSRVSSRCRQAKDGKSGRAAGKRPCTAEETAYYRCTRPKRKMSAYNAYVKEQLAGSAADNMKAIAERWKKMSPAEKARYQDAAKNSSEEKETKKTNTKDSKCAKQGDNNSKA